MRDFKIEEYKISRMTIEKGIISWKDHGIQIAGVARVWAAGVAQNPFPFHITLILLMIALSSARALNLTVMLVILAAYVLAHVISRKLKAKTTRIDRVNLELYSGKIVSLSADNEAFAHKLCETLKHVLEDESSGLHYEILFEDGGSITDRAEKEKKAEPVVAAIPELESDNPIIKELNKLHKFYSEKKAFHSDTLTIIDQAKVLTAKNDTEGLKPVFGKFVTSGLINDCNELGLDGLIQEIKRIFY